jgi:hypothetical protein
MWVPESRAGRRQVAAKLSCSVALRLIEGHTPPILPFLSRIAARTGIGVWIGFVAPVAR